MPACVHYICVYFNITVARRVVVGRDKTDPGNDASGKCRRNQPIYTQSVSDLIKLTRVRIVRNERDDVLMMDYTR